MKRFSGVTFAVAAGMLAIGATQALGATRIVGPPSCPKATYSTIQAAVNAASTGDRIRVCPGTYAEQVSIPAGKNNLTLESMQHWAAVIQAPTAIGAPSTIASRNGPQNIAGVHVPAVLSSPKAIVRVNGAQNVTIKDFTIQGPGDGGCDSLEYGIRIDAGGSATVLWNHITHIRDQPFSGCQNGVGIQAGRAADSTSGSVIAKSNVIDDFQKNGITISNTGSTGTIANNTITGAGPTPIIAQNGIQVSSGATGTVKSNTVSGNVYSPGTVTSTGILLFGPVGTVGVSNNHVLGNDVGVYAYGVDVHTSITGNTATASTFDGITVDTSTGPSVTNNTTNSGDRGIGLYTTSLAQVKNNHATGNASNGYFAGSDTSANVFQNDSAGGSGLFDCRDDSSGGLTAGTANTWLKDTGATSSPLGLCFP